MVWILKNYASHAKAKFNKHIVMSQQMPRSKIAGSHENSIIRFWDAFIGLSFEAETTNIHLNVSWAFYYPYILCSIGFSYSFCANVTVVKWDFTVILNWISLMISTFDDENTFHVVICHLHAIFQRGFCIFLRGGWCLYSVRFFSAHILDIKPLSYIFPKLIACHFILVISVLQCKSF